MDDAGIVAILGGCTVAFVVRVFNIVVKWLAKALDVDPPEPIPAPGSVESSTKDSTGPTG